MLLHRDGLIELNYDPASDVLTIVWPDIINISRSELAYSFNQLCDTLKFYDIKKLLIDSRFNKVIVKEEEYTVLIKKIYERLRTTRLEKTARLGSLDMTREPQAEKHASKLIEELKPGFIFRNFQDPNQALMWLRDS